MINSLRCCPFFNQRDNACEYTRFFSIYDNPCPMKEQNIDCEKLKNEQYRQMSILCQQERP
jgi:hypothetical protein